MGKRIRLMRSAKGFNLTELARRASMDKGYLCRVELGVIQPGIPAVRRIAKILGIPVSSIIEARAA